MVGWGKSGEERDRLQDHAEIVLLVPITTLIDVNTPDFMMDIDWIDADPSDVHGDESWIHILALEVDGVEGRT